MRTSRGVTLIRGVLVTIVIAGAMAVGAAQGAQAAPALIQQSLDALVADGVPGAMALQRQDGKATHFVSGVANLETREPLRAGDRFRIGSITKSFVSTVALQLVGEGRLSLDDTVEHWLPGVVPNGADITVRELMNHTSGVPEYIDIPFYLQVVTDPLRFYTPLELVRRAVAKPPTSPPGTTFLYSNTDYILLGLVIAAVDRVYSHTPLQIAAPAAEVYARIIAPLGLRDTSFPLVDPEIRGPHTHGYIIDPPAELGLPALVDTTVESPSFAWTAGAIVGTLDDLADFHKALFGGRLLRAQQQRELETTVPIVPGVLDYGLGVFKLQTPCGPAWGHDGATPSSIDISLTSEDGSHQAVLMANRDANSWTQAIVEDYSRAQLAVFCNQAPSPAAVRRLEPAMLPLLKLSG
jgi:D-alanyl-D-alanine carboxypeptidase